MLKHLIKQTRHKRLLAGAAACSFFFKIFDIIPEIIIGILLDVIITQPEPLLMSIGCATKQQQIVLLCCLALLVWLIEACFEYADRYLWKKTGQCMQHDLRVDTYTTVQKQLHQATTYSGSITTIINDDINQLEYFFSEGANQIIHLATGTCIILGIFLYVAPLLAPLALLAIPLILITTKIFQRKLNHRYVQLREHASLLGGQLSQKKGNAPSRAQLDSLTHQSFRYKQVALQAARTSALFMPLLRLIIGTGFISTLALAGYFTHHGYLSAGTFSIIVFQTQRLLWPLIHIPSIIDWYERSKACAQRVCNLRYTQNNQIIDPYTQNHTLQERQ